MEEVDVRTPGRHPKQGDISGCDCITVVHSRDCNLHFV